MNSPAIQATWETPAFVEIDMSSEVSAYDADTDGLDGA